MTDRCTDADSGRSELLPGYRQPLHADRPRHLLAGILLAIRQARRLARALDDPPHPNLQEPPEARDARCSCDVRGGSPQIAAREGNRIVFGMDEPVVLVACLS